MTGESLDFKKHLKLQFGQYCQVHEDETVTNTQRPRTAGAISMGPSGNTQGGFKFLSLKTGKKLVRRNWDALPMPDSVIARVNELGKDQPELLTFTDRQGRPIGDVDLTGVAGEEEPQPVVDESDDTDITGDQVEEPTEEQVDEAVEEAFQEDTVVETVSEQEQEPEAQAPEPVPGVVPPHPIPGVRKSARVKFQTRESYVPSLTGSKYALAVTQLEQHGALHPDSHMAFVQEAIADTPDVVAAIMTQLSLKAGMKTWGNKAEKAVHSEMKQLHLRDTFKPMHWKELDETQRKTVLESHMFLKQKRDGTIKGRTVAGGNKQRDYISKEESSSPTVATEAVLLSSLTSQMPSSKPGSKMRRIWL